MVLDMEGGARITFNDARRFGAMDLMPTDTAAEHHCCWPALGRSRSATTSTSPTSLARLKGRKTPIKSALLDQRIVAGLGNIYVCEALYRARISPLRLAGDLRNRRSRALVPADPRGAGRGDRGGRLVACATSARRMASLGYFSKHSSRSMTAKASPARPPAARAP